MSPDALVEVLAGYPPEVVLEALELWKFRRLTTWERNRAFPDGEEITDRTIGTVTAQAWGNDIEVRLGMGHKMPDEVEVTVAGGTSETFCVTPEVDEHGWCPTCGLYPTCPACDGERD